MSFPARRAAGFGCWLLCVQAREKGDEGGVDVIEELAAISVDLRRLGVRGEGLDGRVPLAGRRLGIFDGADDRGREKVGLDPGPQVEPRVERCPQELTRMDNAE